MGDYNFDFVMQMILDTNQMVNKMEGVWQTIREMAGRTIVMNLEANPDFGKASEEVARLESKIKRVEDASSRVIERQKQMGTSAEDAARRINKVLPGTTGRIDTALRSGGASAGREEARRIAQERQKDFREAVRQANLLKAAEAAVDARRQIAANRSGGLLSDPRKEAQAVNTYNEALKQVEKTWDRYARAARKAEETERRIAELTSRINTLKFTGREGTKKHREAVFEARKLEDERSALIQRQRVLTGVSERIAGRVAPLETFKRELFSPDQFAATELQRTLQSLRALRADLPTPADLMGYADIRGRQYYDERRLGRYGRLRESLTPQYNQAYQGMYGIVQNAANQFMPGGRVIGSPAAGGLAPTQVDVKLDREELQKQLTSQPFLINVQINTDNLREHVAIINKSLPRIELRHNIPELRKTLITMLKDVNKSSQLSIPLRADKAILEASIREVIANRKNEPFKAHITVNEAVLKNSLRRIITDMQKLAKDDKGAITLPIKADINALRESIKTLVQPNADYLKAHIGVDKVFFLKSLSEAIRHANTQGFKVEVGAKIPTTPGAVATGLATAGAGAAVAAEKAEAKRVAARETYTRDKVVSNEIRAAVQQDLVGTLRKYGGDKLADAADRLSKVVGGLDTIDPTNRADAVRDAIRQVPELRQMFADALKSAPKGEARDYLLAGQRQLGKDVVTPLDRTRREFAYRDLVKSARQEQQAVLENQFKTSFMRDLLRESNTFQNTAAGVIARPVDLLNEQVQAYKRVLGDVEKYERSILEMTNARTTKEMKSAASRIANARTALKVSEDFLRLQVLGATAGTVQMQRVVGAIGTADSGKPFLYARTTNQRVEVDQATAYQKANELLTRQFSDVWLRLGERADRIRQSLEAKGEFERSARVKDVSFDQVLEGVLGPAGARQDKLLNIYRQTDAAKVLLKENNLLEASEKRQLDFLRQHVGTLQEINAIRQRGIALTQQQTQRIETIQRLDAVRAKRQANPIGFAQAARGFSYTFGLGAVGLTAGYALQNSFRNFVQYEKELKQIQGVLTSKDSNEVQFLSEGIARTAQRYGADLLETAQAAKVLAQAGLSADDVIKELNTTMLGMRGMGVAIETMQELQVSIRAVTLAQAELAKTTEEAARIMDSASDISASVLDKISKVEARYAVGAEHLASALQIVSPVVQQFSNNMRGVEDIFDFTIGLTTVMVEKLRISGNQAGNALKQIVTRIYRPEIARQLQQNFDIGFATPDGEGLLPLDQMLGQINRRYHELNESTKANEQLQAKQLLTLVAGGHRINYLAAILSDYNRGLRIGSESYGAYGDAQERAIIATDSMDASLQRLRTNFQLFVNSMLEGTSVAKGLQTVFDITSSVMGGGLGQGGGFGSLFGLTAGLFGTVGVGKSIYNNLAVSSLASEAGVTSRAAKEAIKHQRILNHGLNAVGASAGGISLAQKGLTGIAKLVTPTGGLILGMLTLVGTLGLLRRSWDWATMGVVEKGLDGIAGKMRDLAEIKIWDAPQLQELDAIARDVGLRTAENAYKRTFDALITSPTAAVQNVATKYGAETPAQLVEAMAKRPQEERARAAVDLALALGDAYDEVGGKLGSIAEEEERIVLITQLVGNTAWAANFQIADSIRVLRDETSQLIATAMDGVQRLDKATRTGWIQKTYGALIDGFTGRLNLDSTISVVRPGTRPTDPQFSPSQLALLDAADPTFMAGQLPNNRGASAVDQVESILGVFEQVSPEIAKAAKNSIAFSTALDRTNEALAEAGKQQVTLAEFLQEFFTQMDTLQATRTQIRARFDPNVASILYEPLKNATLQDQLVSDVGNQILDSMGFRELVQKLNPDFLVTQTRAPAKEFAQDAFGEFLQEVREYVISQGTVDAEFRGRPGIQLAELSEFLKNMHGVNLALSTGAERLHTFRDKLLDLLMSLFVESEKVRVQAQLNASVGRSYNRGEAQSRVFEDVLGRLGTFRAEGLTDVVRVQRRFQDLQRLAGGRISATTDTGEEVELSGLMDIATLQSANEKARKQFELQGLRLRDETAALLLSLSELESMDLGDVFPDTPEAQEIITGLRSVIQEFKGGIISEDTLISRLSDNLMAAWRTTIAMSIEFQKQQKYYEGLIQTSQELSELEKTRLEFIRDPIQRARAENALENNAIRERIALMNQMVSAGLASADETEIQIEVLRLDQRRMALVRARRTEIEAINTLEKQSRDNLQGMMSGFMSAFQDLNIWGALAKADGQGEFRSALQSVVLSTLQPVGSTFYGRILEGFGRNIQDILQESFFADLFRLPEFEMKNAVADGGMLAAQFMQQGIIDGAYAASVMLGRTPVESDGDPLRNPDTFQSAGITRRNQFALQIGSMLGNIGGTVLGGGGEFAQLGASLGSLVGLLAGSAGGPILGGIGAAAGGGLLGLLLGGLDKRDAETGLTSLSAIERAQRDTITAIEQQTSALLNPTATALNLPSNFNIPTYMPQYASASGGVYISENNTIAPRITVMGTNLSGAEIEAAVSKGIADGLSTARKNTSRSNSRY